MKILVSLLLSIACTTAAAQPSETRGLPGYVEFGELSAVYGEPKVRINIGKKLLQFVAQMDTEGDQEGKQLLSKLDAVRVEVYKMNSDSGPAVSMLEKMSKELQSHDWEPVVTVTDEGDHVRIFVKLNKDTIGGLVVMAVDKKDEAVFINIIGDIDPAQVGKVTKALDLDVDL